MKLTTSHIDIELPDASALAELGIDLELQEARLVLAVASRVLIHRNGQERSELYRALSMIAAAVGAELLDEDGDLQGPLIDPADTDSWKMPHPRAVQRRLGFRVRELNAVWDEATTYPGSCLPVEIVLKFLPPVGWRILSALIAAGPYEARARLHRAAALRGKSMGEKALRSHLDETWLVLEKIVDIRTQVQGRNDSRARKGKRAIAMAESLDAWAAKPKAPSAGEIRSLARGGKAHDTTAVPQDVIKQRIHELALEAEWGRWRPEDWPFNRNWLSLKRLVVLVVLAVIGPRKAHLQGMTMDAVVLDHVFRDGTRGPALLMRGEHGMKGRQPGYVYAIRLPQIVADMLHAWIVCNGKTPGHSGSALFPPTKAKHPGDPQRHAQDIGQFVSPPETSTHPRTPLVPLAGNKTRGYATHRFRSTVTQEVDRLVANWKFAEPGHDLHGYSKKAFAECLLDHTHADLGYRDLRTDPGANPTYRFEQLASMAVELWFAELWGDGPGVFRGLDLDRLEAAHTRVLVLASQIEDLAREITALAQEKLRLSAAGASGPERDAIGDRRELLLEQRDELRVKLAQREKELADALTQRVLLPIGTQESHERRERELLALLNGSPVETESHQEPGALADELTASDIATLFGVSPQHVGRWRRGLSHPPIDSARWRCVNAKDYRYPVAALDDVALRRIPAADPHAALEQVRRERARSGFSRRP